jgi:hypothetical protein
MQLNKSSGMVLLFKFIDFLCGIVSLLQFAFRSDDNKCSRTQLCMQKWKTDVSSIIVRAQYIFLLLVLDNLSKLVNRIFPVSAASTLYKPDMGNAEILQNESLHLEGAVQYAVCTLLIAWNYHRIRDSWTCSYSHRTCLDPTQRKLHWTHRTLDSTAVYQFARTDRSFSYVYCFSMSIGL